jgi:serine/threonine protein kinase
MERTTFLDHYRICTEYDGSPMEIGRVGPAIIYRALDLRSDAYVALTLLPIASIDPEARESFEQKARAAQQLDHLSIAKTTAFGVVDDHFVLVSEYPFGETVETWIAAHGPMPPDAVLRIALQVVSALSAATFHGLTHPAVHPSNLVIVPGGTAEGGWPHVKLLGFGLAGLKIAPGQEIGASELASPEQLQSGMADFRSEIYSLGATMCFLLTGAFYSAEPRSLQTRRFARPLRNLITPMLRQNPDERPQDPVLFTQAARLCLQKVERRQVLARKLGIPFVAVKARRAKRRPEPMPVPLVGSDVVSGPVPIEAPLSRTVSPVAFGSHDRPRFFWRAIAVTALLLVFATAAAFLLPAPVGMILHRNRDKDAIGVPVGVPDSSATAVAQNRLPATAPAPSAPPVQFSATNVPSPSSSVSDENKLAANPSQTISPTETARQPATASSPIVVSKNESAAAVANQPVAPTPYVVNQPMPSAQQNASGVTPQAQSGGAEGSPSTSPRVVAAEPAAQPSPPAEGPQTVWEREAGVKQRIATQNEKDERDDVSASTEQRNKKTTSRSSAASSKSRSKTKEVASNSRRSGSTRYSRRPQVPPDQQDQYQPYHGEQTPRVRRALPLPEGTFRAQVIGTTPEGDVILRLPSGEIAIAPRHRPRRVIERPYFAPPPRPDFAPPFPPDA